MDWIDRLLRRSPTDLSDVIPKEMGGTPNPANAPLHGLSERDINDIANQIVTVPAPKRRAEPQADAGFTLRELNTLANNPPLVAPAARFRKPGWYDDWTNADLADIANNPPTVTRAAVDAVGGNQYEYGVNFPTGSPAPSATHAYLAARPVEYAPFASHTFIATDAAYPGDPNATVISFGEPRDRGPLGRVSGIVHDRDVVAWKHMNPNPNHLEYTQIPTDNQTVNEVATRLAESEDYAAFAGPFGLNSNSAAQAVANRAAGQHVPIPGFPRRAHGWERWRDVPFHLTDK